MPLDKKLSDRLKQWNPMQDAYNNSEFNQYSSGPGASLGPASQRNNNNNNQHYKSGGEGVKQIQKPYLVFKNIPENMTVKALRNICARHGKVTYVRNSTKNDYYFVDLPTVADQEAIFRALEDNTYGFTVLMGKEKKQRDSNDVQNSRNVNDNYKNRNSDERTTLPTKAPPPVNTVEMQNRSYHASQKQPTRPYVKPKPFVTAEKYAAENSLLQRNDPQRHFLIADDAHELERAGLQQSQKALLNNDKFKYSTGRAYIDMPDSVRDFIKNAHSVSSGNYNATEGAFQHAQAAAPTILEKCAECGKLCDTVCERCRTYFCNVECQKKAWPKHRVVCGKPADFVMPPIEDITNCNALTINSTSNSKFHSTQTFSSPNSKKNSDTSSLTTSPSSTTSSTEKSPMPEVNMPPNGNLVTLTAISKMNVVFIRSKSDEDNISFFRTISAIQADANYLSKLKNPPRCGQIVIANFRGQFNRAMILNADVDQRIRLIYIDYGNLDVKALSELYEAPGRYISLPRKAIPVILKDVPDCYMSAEAHKFIYSYLDDIDLELRYRAEDLIVEKGVYRVELLDQATNKSLNATLASLCKAIEPKNVDEVYFRNYLKQEVLPAGQNIKFIVMDNSLLSTGCISCTTKEYALEIQKFQLELQRYAESVDEQTYAPRVDELCIAKYDKDQKWYRGRCLELVGDGFPMIVFFDYGNVAYVNVKDIRRYPALFTYPIYTNDCEIEGLPEQCDEKLVARLEELIPNGSVISCARVKAYEKDSFYSISLPEVMTSLREEGLLHDAKEH